MSRQKTLLTQRAALILLIGVVVGIAAAVLTRLESGSTPGALLAGGAACGAAVLLFHAIIN